jgi:hypothetical protein
VVAHGRLVVAVRQSPTGFRRFFACAFAQAKKLLQPVGERTFANLRTPSLTQKIAIFCIRSVVTQICKSTQHTQAGGRRAGKKKREKRTAEIWKKASGLFHFKAFLLSAKMQW